MTTNGLAYLILTWVISAVALMLTSLLLPGFRLRNFGSAMIAAAVVGVANYFLRPLLLFLAFPLNILTLGLFTFVVDAVILKLAAYVLSDFEITSWVSAIIGAVVLTVIGTLLHSWIV